MKKIVLMLFLFSTLCFATDHDIISVSAVGFAEYKPDVVIFNYRVEAEGERVGMLIEDIELRVADFKKLAYTKKIDKEKYNDASMSISSRKNKKKMTKVSSDNKEVNVVIYKVSRTITFRLYNIKELESIVMKAAELNFVGYNSISFASSNLKKYEDLAYKDAVKNAKDKAELLVNEFGKKLGKVVEIKDSMNLSTAPVRAMSLDNSYSVGVNRVEKPIFVKFQIK